MAGFINLSPATRVDKPGLVYIHYLQPRQVLVRSHTLKINATIVRSRRNSKGSMKGCELSIGIYIFAQISWSGFQNLLRGVASLPF